MAELERPHAIAGAEHARGRCCAALTPPRWAPKVEAERGLYGAVHAMEMEQGLGAEYHVRRWPVQEKLADDVPGPPSTRQG